MMKEQYLLLQSIDPHSNRHRIYRIHVLEVEIGHKTQFVVSCSWGRFQTFSHQKQFLFEEQDELNRFIQSLLKLRKRHDYTIVGRSSTFPKVQALYEVLYIQLIPLQATLF